MKVPDRRTYILPVLPSGRRVIGTVLLWFVLLGCGGIAWIAHGTALDAERALTEEHVSNAKQHEASRRDREAIRRDGDMMREQIQINHQIIGRLLGEIEAIRRDDAPAPGHAGLTPPNPGDNRNVPGHESA